MHLNRIYTYQVKIKELVGYLRGVVLKGPQEFNDRISKDFKEQYP